MHCTIQYCIVSTMLYRVGCMLSESTNRSWRVAALFLQWIGPCSAYNYSVTISPFSKDSPQVKAHTEQHRLHNMDSNVSLLHIFDKCCSGTLSREKVFLKRIVGALSIRALKWPHSPQTHSCYCSTHVASLARLPWSSSGQSAIHKYRFKKKKSAILLYAIYRTFYNTYYTY